MASKQKPVSTRTAVSKKKMADTAEHWDMYFEVLISCVLAEVEDKEKRVQAIRVAADLADVALGEYELRWQGV